MTFPPKSIKMKCFHCNEEIQTKVDSKATCLSYLFCTILCFLGYVCFPGISSSFFAKSWYSRTWPVSLWLAHAYHPSQWLSHYTPPTHSSYLPDQTTNGFLTLFPQLLLWLLLDSVLHERNPGHYSHLSQVSSISGNLRTYSTSKISLPVFFLKIGYW